MFEPTDLEFESSGVMELDVQVGAIRGADAYRLTVPDFEIDIGISRRFELDLDGAFAIEGPATGAIRYDHIVMDNWWLALKSGLFSIAGSSRKDVVSMGLQLGPKLPTSVGAQGLGLETLSLLGFATAHTHWVVNFGALLDPATRGARRPAGVEGGVALDHDLDNMGQWVAFGQLAAVHFISAEPAQLQATAGISLSPTESFTWSLAATAGLYRGSDRYGALLGFAPKYSLL
jgi:hypothetical protein